MNNFSSMTLFWISVAAFVAAALAFVLPSLLRRRNPHGGIDRGAVNVAIYQDQLRDLEAEFNCGEIPREQYDRAQLEIAKRISQDVPFGQRPAASPRGRWAGFAVAGVVPVAAIGIYLVLGNPTALTAAPSAPPPASAASQPQAGPHDATAMVNALEKKLKQNPNDVEGWAMLGRSYAAMGRMPDAFKAYEKAISLAPDDAHLLSDYAEVVAISQGRTMQGKPTELVARALKLNGKDQKGLMLAGVAAGQQGDFAQAAVYWRKLLKVVEPNTPLAKEVAAAIEKADQKAAAGKQPSGQQKAEGKAVSGTLTIKSELASKLSPSDTVFVFAQSPDGIPMPLAVLKINGSQLPYHFKLDDSLAMSPANRLTQHPEVILVARVSKSGQPAAKSGDLQGKVGPVKLGRQDVKLSIDTVVP